MFLLCSSVASAGIISVINGSSGSDIVANYNTMFSELYVGEGGGALDVRAYLPVGFVTDASVDYQTEVAAAVAAAYVANLELYWPHVYLTSANIPNFHDVRHKGPGGVKRGSTTFYVEPTTAQTNTLNVATTGNDANDGITSSQPVATIQKALNILAEFAPVLPGRWVVSIANGTYTETLVMDSASRSEYPVAIKAATTAGHPNVPGVVIQPTVSSDNILTFSEGRGWFQLTDLRFTGATTGTALVLNGGVRVSATNVHIDACLKGVTSQHQSLFSPSGGIWTGRGKAVAGGIGLTSQYASTHSFTGTGAGDGVQVNDFERGLLINEGAQGHIDGAQISNCGTGLNNKRGAGAVNTTAVYIEKCDIGILNENNAWFNNAISFGTGGNANTVNVRSLGDSPELVQRTTTALSRTMRLVETKYALTHTGNTTQTAIWTMPTIPAWAISEAGDTTRLTMYGQPTLTNAAANLYIVLDNGTRDELASVTIPQGTTDFYVTVDVMFTGDSAQRCSFIVTTGAGNILGYGTGSLNMKNTAGFLTLETSLVNGADTMTIRFGEYFSTIGG